MSALLQTLEFIFVSEAMQATAASHSGQAKNAGVFISGIGLLDCLIDG